MDKTLGQVGYEKWRSLLEPHATAGLPDWNRLPEGSRLAWEDVANTIVEADADFAIQRVWPV